MPRLATVSTPEAAADLAAQGGSDPQWKQRRDGEAGWRQIAAAPAVALFTLIAAIIVAGQAGFTFRDPDHVAALYVLEVGAGIALLVCLDIFLRARKRGGSGRPSKADLAAVRRERWTGRRIWTVALALVAFYLTYLAYRNLKAAIPLLRPDDLFDSQLADIDKALFFGNDPATLLHQGLGTGAAAHVMSAFYVAFIVFLPLSLGLALVFAERIKVSLLYATALSINWVLGAASYFLIPALGPVYYDKTNFSALPRTEVTHLQEMLMSDRVGFLADPANGTLQAVAAFASLHIAISFTALLATYMVGAGSRVKQVLWAWLAITFTATVYLGWHYVLDDLAGLAIGAASLLLAVKLTGFDPRPTNSRAGTEAVGAAVRG
jgi:hypothetical protein